MTGLECCRNALTEPAATRQSLNASWSTSRINCSVSASIARIGSCGISHACVVSGIAWFIAAPPAVKISSVKRSSAMCLAFQCFSTPSYQNRGIQQGILFSCGLWSGRKVTLALTGCLAVGRLTLTRLKCETLPENRGIQQSGVLAIALSFLGYVSGVQLPDCSQPAMPTSCISGNCDSCSFHCGILSNPLLAVHLCRNECRYSVVAGCTWTYSGTYLSPVVCIVVQYHRFVFVYATIIHPTP
jgi:hypothetical protein